MLRRALAIAWIALTGSACCSQRAVTRDERLVVRGYEQKDSSKVESIDVRDTVREVTTITIRENERGDTLRITTVRDRERTKSSDRVAAYSKRMEVVRDTIYLEKRDSIEIRSRPEGQSGGTALHRTLKWVFWIIIGLIGLVIVLRIRT